MTRDFIKDFIKYIPSVILPAGISFLSVPLYTRFFPPAEFGEYSISLATSNIFIIFSGFLSMSIIRFLVIYEKDNKLEDFYIYLSKAIIISIFFLTLLFFIIVLSIKRILSVNLFTLMMYGVIYFFLISIFNTITSLMWARREINLYNFFTIIRSLIVLIVVIFLVLIFKMNIKSIYIGNIFIITASLPFLLVKSRLKNPFIKKSNFNRFFSEIFKYSFPLVLGNLAAWILSLSDRYIIMFFRNSFEVGIYSASYNISENSVLLLINLFQLASSPIMMNIWEKEGIEQSRKFISNLTRYYIMVCLPFIFFLSSLSKPLFLILVEKQYFEGYKVLPLVTFGAFFLGLQMRFQAGFIFLKKTFFITIATIISGIINILLNLIFVPVYGYIFAAVNTLFSYFIFFLLIAILSKNYFTFPFPYKSTFKIVIASIIPSAFIYWFTDFISINPIIEILISLFIGVIIYISLLIIMSEISESEIKKIKEFFIKKLKRNEKIY